MSSVPAETNFGGSAQKNTEKQISELFVFCLALLYPLIFVKIFCTPGLSVETNANLKSHLTPLQVLVS